MDMDKVVEYLMSAYIMIDFPDFSITILPNNNVWINIKNKIITLQDGYDITILNKPKKDGKKND